MTDPSAGVVPNVTVTAVGPRAADRTARTDASGRYQFAALPPGTYTLRATAPGFAPFEQTGYEVRPGQAQTFDIALILRAQSQQLTVAESTAATLDTDPSNNAAALVLENNDLDALPDDKDDLSDDLLALAGPAAGPNGGQFFIDGFTGGRLPPKQSIREIRINQNPFAAQFDKPGQGRIEIFTKPGTDEFHGEVLFQFSDAALNSRNPFSPNKPPYRRKQWESEVSGPLGKKTSFFADFERRDISENALINAIILDSNFNPLPFAQSVVTPITGVEANLKIDRQLSTNNTLSAKYGYDRDTNNNSGVGNFSLADRAYLSTYVEQTFQVIETAVLNLHTVNEARFRFNKQDSDESGGAASPTLNVQEAFTTGGSPVGTSFNYQNHYELQNFTSYISGLHTIRFGGIMRGVTLDDQSMQNYSGTFTFNSLAAYSITLQGVKNGLTPQQIRAAGGGASQFSLAAGNPLASLSQFDFGFFIQDDWRMRPGLTLSGGIRYETQTNSPDRRDIAPRLGVAWALDRDKRAPKNIVRAGVGIFYDRLSESLTLDALRQNGIRQQEFLIQNPDFYPAVPSVASLSSAAQPQTIRETDAHWRAPSTLQMALGFERQLPKHITVSTNYIHSIGDHVLRSRNINAPLPVTGSRPYGGVNSIYLYEASGIYRQDQFTVNFNAKVNSKFSLTGYYVWSKAMSNTDGASTFPANQYDLSGEYSRASFENRHRFQLNGSISPRWGLRFSPFITFISGRPYNIYTGIDSNGDGLFTDRPAGLPRNSAIAPGLIGANMRISKSFNLGEHKPGEDSERQLVFSINARNFLNHPNLNAPVGNLSSPLFGHSTALATRGNSGNRRIDLQVKFTF